MQTAEQIAIVFYSRFGIKPTNEQIENFFPDFLEQSVRVYRSAEDLVAGYLEALQVEFTDSDRILIRELNEGNIEAIETVAEVLGLDMVIDVLNQPSGK